MIHQGLRDGKEMESLELKIAEERAELSGKEVIYRSTIVHGDKEEHKIWTVNMVRDALRRKGYEPPIPTRIAMIFGYIPNKITFYKN